MAGEVARRVTLITYNFWVSGCMEPVYDAVAVTESIAGDAEAASEPGFLLLWSSGLS